MFGGMPGLELVGLEDSTAPYESAKRMNVAKLAKFDTGQTLQNREVGQLGRTWPTLFVMFGGMPGLELVGLEDSTAPYE